MRVLYVVSLFPCWSETFIVREIRELLRLGVDVRILSLRHPSEALVQSDAAALLDRVAYPARWGTTLLAVAGALAGDPAGEIRRLWRFAVRLWRHPAVLAKTLVTWWRATGLVATAAALAPGHVHAHFATYPSTAAMLLSRRLGVPFSFTAHAHDIFLEDHLLSDKVREAAFVVAISCFNRRFLRERVEGAARADVRIVHCGVFPQEFPLVTEGRDAHLVLAVGRLDAIKGFPTLVEACALLRDRGAAFRCELVGSGPLQATLEARVRELGLGGQVRLAGTRKQEEVRALMQTAGIFAMPSVVTPRGDRDGIPVALMEAMASGLPVVSTRVSGIPELVEDGVTGLLADPGDAAGLAACLERLLADPALGAALARRARDRVERDFDVRAEARKLHDAFAGRS
ncbi:MAG: glycosyltransferase [Lysobacter sp.]|nr:glycosyltransferase [Lysobacter sp.]